MRRIFVFGFLLLCTAATASDPGPSLLTYTTEPGSPSHDALNLLARWTATTNNLEQPPSTGDAEQAQSVRRPD